MKFILEGDLLEAGGLRAYRRVSMVTADAAAAQKMQRLIKDSLGEMMAGWSFFSD